MCTLVRDVATKDPRWVRCSCWSLGPSPRRPITVVCPRRGAVTAFAHLGSLYSPSNASIATRVTAVCTSYCCCCVIKALLLKFFTSLKTDAIFRFDNPMGPSRQILGQNLCRLGPSDSRMRFYPVGFAISDCVRSPIIFQKNKNLKARNRIA